MESLTGMSYRRTMTTMMPTKTKMQRKTMWLSRTGLAGRYRTDEAQDEEDAKNW